MHLLSNCVPRVWINNTWTRPSHLWYTHSYTLTQTAQDILNTMKYVGGCFSWCGTQTTTYQPTQRRNSTFLPARWKLNCHPSAVDTNIFLPSNCVCSSCVQDGRKKGKRRDEAGKRTREKRGKESASLTDTYPESVSQQPPDDQNVELEVMNTRLLHKKASHLIIFPYMLYFFILKGTPPILHTKVSLLVMRSTSQPVKTVVTYLLRFWENNIDNVIRC